MGHNMSQRLILRGYGGECVGEIQRPQNRTTQMEKDCVGVKKKRRDTAHARYKEQIKRFEAIWLV